MRYPSIVRITLPVKETFPPKPERDAAAALLKFAGLYENKFRLLLDPPILRGLSKPERQVLTATHGVTLARDLAKKLVMDQGQLSRILGRLETKGLVFRQEAGDGRQWPVKLTAAGRLERLHIKRARKEAVAGLLQTLSKTQRNELAVAVDRVREMFR